MEEYALDRVMSVFGHCMSRSDSMEMWALQVAATNGKKEWCEQVDRQALELHIAIVLAGIYMTGLKETENGGPRFLTNYDAEDAEEENVVICGACHTSCTQLGKSKRCTESTICESIGKCESKGQIHGCTQQGCSSNGVRRACMDCVRHTSEREKVYIQRVGDVEEMMQARVREAMEFERVEATTVGHPVETRQGKRNQPTTVGRAQAHKGQSCTNKTQDGRATMLPDPEVVEMTAIGSSSRPMGQAAAATASTRGRCSTWPGTRGASAQGEGDEVFQEDRDEIERLTRQTTGFQKVSKRVKEAADTSWTAVAEGT